jgi:hypothetical protein
MEPSLPPPRSGVLVARAWHESDTPQSLRVRVIWSAGPAGVPTAIASHTTVVCTAEAFLDLVAGWLAAVTDRAGSA